MAVWTKGWESPTGMQVHPQFVGFFVFETIEEAFVVAVVETLFLEVELHVPVNLHDEDDGIMRMGVVGNRLG